MPVVTSALIGGGASLLGGLFGGNAAKKAAQTNANATLEAARIAADAQRFRPVGVTTAFGSSNFGTDAQGNLTSAGYQLSPEMARQRDMLLQQAKTQGLDIAQQAGEAGQGLFRLGRGYLAETPEQAANIYLQRQQAALAPGQEQQLANIRNQQQQQGRAGLAVGATMAGGMGASNPELQAYYNSLALTNLDLAGKAQAEGRAQTQFATGLLGSGIDITSQGYNPYKTQFGLAQGLESAGQNALDLGLNIGGRTAQAGANVGQTLFTGGQGAARTMQAANQYSPFGDAISGLANNKQFTSGVATLFNPYGGTPQGAYGQQDQYLSGAYSNPQTQQARMLTDQMAGFYEPGNPLQTGQYADAGYWT